MPKLIRRGVAPLVALLCVTVAVLWVRSYRLADSAAVYGRVARLQAVASHAGRLIVVHSDLRFDGDRAVRSAVDSVPAEEFQVTELLLFEGADRKWSLAGFMAAQGQLPFGGSAHYTAVAVPHWAAFGLTLVPSGLWLRNAVRRRRRVRHGQCGACGYDLRSTPDRCPECGAAVAAKRAPAAAAAATVCLLLALTPAFARADEPDVAARVIKDLDLSDATLEQAFTRVAELSNANLVVRWPALRSAGFPKTTRVRAHLWDVSVPTAMDVILKLVDTDPPTLGWQEKDGVITVTTADELKWMLETRIYDLRDVIALVKKEVTPDPPGDDSRTWQEVVDELVRLITEVVEPDSWRDAGGESGSIRELGGRFVITQTPRALKQVEALLVRFRAEMRKPPPPLVAPAATGPSDDAAPGATRFYDVRDLLAAIRAQPGDRAADFEASAELVGVIIDHVSPAVWRGEVSGIDVIGGRLVVTKSDEKVHAEVAQFLERLRREILPRAASAPATSPSAPTRPPPPAGEPPRSARGSPSAARPPAR
jgi:hypothetical protein